MYGVLLVETASGQQRVLKAFSGLLDGQSQIDGWVPPIPGRESVVLAEAYTLARLDAIKHEMLALQTLSERSCLTAQAQEFDVQLQQLIITHAQYQHQRQHQRQHLLETLTGELLKTALEELNQQSQQDGMQRRRLKRDRDQQLQPLKQIVDRADTRLQELKQQRKQLSQQLQAQMHTAYSLTNFAGDSQPLHQLLPIGSIPTGTGDCCAPKLLHYAATHHLKPLTMAEFWWGLPSANSDKVSGKFYGACADRCQPLMGFLLSGLPQSSPLIKGTGAEPASPILYEDKWLIAIAKPPGLLSVPGRYLDQQDCVQSRLQQQFPTAAIVAVHRLDQATSGILLLARDSATHRQLSQQFQQRQVHKLYEALLGGVIAAEAGVIELPLWADPSDRPRQKVDWHHGKSSTTQFRVMARENAVTRIEFTPLTGRTHQLRVHAASPDGLGVPILGDRLYSCQQPTHRLHLHAKDLTFQHPYTRNYLHLKTPVPF